jgi:hypothetical protein
MTNVIDAAGNITAVAGTFTGLVSSTVGFSGSATNLVGNASGLTAGTATRIIATSTNSASTFYPTFVGGAGTTGLFIDPTIGPLSYVPSTATLNLSNLNFGAGALTINALEVIASSYFYFVASGGIYFQDPTLISMGDVGATAGKTLFEVYPTTGTRYACLYNSDFANNATLMVNRSTPVGTHAFEANRSDGKAIKLIYNDTGGAATNYVDLDVSSSGDFTITPSGGDVTVAGSLYANNIVNTINGLSGGVTFAAGTNITLVPSGNTITINSSGGGGGGSSVTSFNGLTGAVTGVSYVNGLTGGLTFAAGTGITFTTSGNTITIVSAPKSTTQTLDFSESINGLEIVFYGTGVDFSTGLRGIEKLNSISVSVNSYTCTLVSIQSFYDSTNGWSARLIVKPPFAGNVSAETIYLAGVGSVTINGYSGLALLEDTWLDIDSSEIYHQEETYVTKTVTGQSWVAADSYIICKVLGLTTSDHTPEDAILEGVQFEINNIVAGTGFDIIGHAPEGTYGKYTVKCIEQ